MVFTVLWDEVVTMVTSNGYLCELVLSNIPVLAILVSDSFSIVLFHFVLCKNKTCVLKHLLLTVTTKTKSIQ